MSTRLPSRAPWSVPSYPPPQAVETSACDRDVRGQPSAFLRWLDKYFGATSEERMGAEYLAYWN